MKLLLSFLLVFPALVVADIQIRVKSNYEAGADAFQAGNIEMALVFFQQGADKGEADSQAALGTHYYFGDGVEKDLTKALELFEQSAAQDDALGHSMLGIIYNKGDEVPPNPEKAYQHARKAAVRCLAQSQNQVAHQLYQGQGVEQNKPEALAWLVVSEQFGNEHAQDGIAHILSELTDEQAENARVMAEKLNNELLCQ